MIVSSNILTPGYITILSPIFTLEPIKEWLLTLQFFPIIEFSLIITYSSIKALSPIEELLSIIDDFPIPFESLLLWLYSSNKSVKDWLDKDIRKKDMFFYN